MIPIWHGCYDNNNFGDHVGAYIIEKLTNQKTIFVHPHVKTDIVNVYSGSVLREAKDNWVCYGLGFGDEEHKCNAKPKIVSVRGKLSRDMLIAQGIECPEVYFDICEYLPKLYNPKIKKEYGIGYIPHYLDYNDYKNFANKNENVIDICSGIENVITEMLKCEVIRSTSLHGLILADVYGIERYWNKSHNLESEFKFHDYFTRYE